MNRVCVWICIMAFLLAGCGHKAAKKASPPLTISQKLNRSGASDRERYGLVGPVREQRCRTVALRAGERGPVEAGWKQVFSRRYRRDGRLSEIIVRNSPLQDPEGRSSRVVNRWSVDGRNGEQLCYGRDGKLNEKIVFTFDGRDKLPETDCYGPDGSLQGKFVRQYDADGRETEERSYRPDGSVSWKRTMKYETGGTEQSSQYGPNGKLESVSVSIPLAKGNGFEAVFSDGNGRLQNKHVCRFDAHWNATEDVWSKPDGRLMSKRAWSLDAKGNVLVHTEWNANGSIKLKESSEYTFDSKGNWTKRMVFRQVTKNGKPEMAPYEVCYRAIAYY
ncbi:MAG: hypothetical protein Q7T82_08610 [Armatimonadota bacterium]|nr:hypothetical protein [Armatimonadota bacterium]